jgi:hypothetical protein
LARAASLRRAGDAAAGFGGEAVLERLEPRTLRGGGELPRQPAPGGADAARLRSGLRQRVPGTEPDQLRHRGLQRRRLDALREGLDARIAARGRDSGQQ